MALLDDLLVLLFVLLLHDHERLEVGEGAGGDAVASQVVNDDHHLLLWAQAFLAGHLEADL